MTEPVSSTYKLDLDALAEVAADAQAENTLTMVTGSELTALVRIARAAVQWREEHSVGDETPLLFALQEAGV